MDEGKHNSFLPASMIGTFRDHVAPPDAENTDMAEDLDIIDGSGFWGHFFFFLWKNHSLIGGAD